MKKAPEQLTNRDAANLFFTLRGTNGAPKAVFDSKLGKDVQIQEPYHLSAQVTLQIARNMGYLKQRLDEYNSVVVTYKDLPDREAKTTELLNTKVPVSLEVIPYSSLRVGETAGLNRIPPGSIMEMFVILDLES